MILSEAKDIRESTKNDQVEVEKVDLDSLDSVNVFVARFLAKKVHCTV